MEDDSRFGSLVKWGLGAVGLGAVVAVVKLPKDVGIWVAVGIIVLFLLLFGGYYLWRKIRARRQSRMFSSAIEAQTAAAPKSISDPNQRAALDKLRQKFQTGMQEFRSRGKDIYKLPWYVIIGESGSGKTEAIRHSGVEFPPGLQDELQGSGGTVNMDWWFTNRAIILDTAGSMIFRETQAGDAPEWREFLRLLKKSRPQCPINGLFLVLSIESLIKDSADRIAEKASKLAQQLDLIQRTMDVRFPVYLLVTKADLLTGFREFFDNIDDPLLQHQMFGWSNPDPLDSHFRPELIEQHLKSVADRLRRRRLALLLREGSASSPGRLGDTGFFSASAQPLGGARSVPQRRLDEVDALFALPESVMRLVPRLRRYLETVFVAGEWSSKPVFLRGVYFTSSMREGKALDEAMALATGLSVDQLPEDRTWEKNRAFFLRDLFVEKVFRENGLVTRATNTIQLLRQRQLAIFGTASVALLLLVVLAMFGHRDLNRSALEEAEEWEAGARGWKQGAWSPAIVSPGKAEDLYHFTYSGTNAAIAVGTRNLSVVQYHQRLKEVASKKLRVSWIFKPFSWLGLGEVKERQNAQRILLEQGVLRPLIEQTRNKMLGQKLDTNAVHRHREALLALIQFQTDQSSVNGPYLSGTNAATNLHSLISYLTDSDTYTPDTNLVEILAWTYSEGGSGRGTWPPKKLLSGDRLTNNPAIQKGVADIREISQRSADTIKDEVLPRLTNYLDDLKQYANQEHQWLNNSANLFCSNLTENVYSAREKMLASQQKLKDSGVIIGPQTNLAAAYRQLEAASREASRVVISKITAELPEHQQTEAGLLNDIRTSLQGVMEGAAASVKSSLQARRSDIADLDANYLAVATGNPMPVFEQRYSLYDQACKLASESAKPVGGSPAEKRQVFQKLVKGATNFSKELSEYSGPHSKEVRAACEPIVGEAESQIMQQVSSSVHEFDDVTNAHTLFKALDNGWSRFDKRLEQNPGVAALNIALVNARKEAVSNYAVGQINELNAKFPVLLDSPETFDENGLKRIKDALARLAIELENMLVWTEFPGHEGFLQQLRARSSSYAGVVNSLLNPEGTPAEVELCFWMPATGTPEAKLYTSKLRFFKIFVDGEERKLVGFRPGDLSSFQHAKGVISIVAKISVKAGLRFEFVELRDQEAKTVYQLEAGKTNWMLPRLIQRGQAERDGSGTEWKLKLPVTVADAAQTLEAFSLRLNPNKPLPSKEEWPKK